MSAILGDASFSIRKVFLLTFWVFRARYLFIILISLLVFLPSLAISLYSPGAYRGDLGEVEANLLTLGQIFLSVLLTTILVGGTINQLSGDRHLFANGEIDGNGLASPVLLTCVLFSLGVTVGFALLAVPGVFLKIIWWVAIPVAVIERPGVLRSFGRSTELTKGHRWKILAAFLLVLAVGSAVYVVATEVLAPGGFWGVSRGLSDESMYPAFIPFLICSWIIGVMVAAFEAVLVGVSYALLRMEKERTEIDQAFVAFD